jgi:hypothetical protein
MPTSDQDTALVYGRNVTFDSPDAKAERLPVLTGGIELEQLFVIRRVALVIDPNPIQNVVKYSDLYFTNVGLLIVTYGSYMQQGNLGTAIGVLAISTAAGIGGAIGSSIEMKKADNNYRKLSTINEGRNIVELFKEFGDFLPSDEIKDFSKNTTGLAQFEFRGKLYILSSSELEVDLLENWRKQTLITREGASHNHPYPGILALLEWSHRPENDLPSWLYATLRECATKEIANSNAHVLRSAGYPFLGDFGIRLAQLGDDNALIIRKQIRNIISKVIRLYLIGCVISLIVGITSVIFFLAATDVINIEWFPSSDYGLLVLFPTLLGLILFITFLTWMIYTNHHLKRGFSTAI